MTLETRLKNLENLVNALSRKIDRNNYYTSADTAGVRENMGQISNDVKDITPYTASATAYIDDTQVIFSNVPSGNVTVFMTDGEGQNVSHTVEYVNGSVVVMFEKRNSLATVNISII